MEPDFLMVSEWRAFSCARLQQTVSNTHSKYPDRLGNCQRELIALFLID